MVKNCRLCGSPHIRKKSSGVQQTSTYFTNNTYQLVACLNCHTWFKEPFATHEQISAHYNSLSADGIDWEKHEVLPHQKHIYDELSNLNSGILLDVGCWTGGLLADYTKLKNYQIYGLEPNAGAAKKAQSKGYHIIGKQADDIKHSTLLFDRIYLIDVIEHLINPVEVLNILISKLAQNGKLIVVTGNNKSWPFILFKTNYWYLKFPDHLAFYSNKSFTQIKGLTGLKIEVKYTKHYWHTNKRFIENVKSFIKFILSKCTQKTAFVHLGGITDHLFVVLSKS